MSEKGKFGEPWERDGDVIMDTPYVTSDINDVCYMNAEKEEIWEKGDITWIEYRDRIIACVNALDGREPAALAELEAAVDAVIKDECYCKDHYCSNAIKTVGCKWNGLKAALAKFQEGRKGE